MFIGLAAVAGIVAGRLARALTEHNADEKADAQRLSTRRRLRHDGATRDEPGCRGGPTAPPTSYAGVAGETTYPVTGTDDLTETPLYAERSASLSGGVDRRGGRWLCPT